MIEGSGPVGRTANSSVGARPVFEASRLSNGAEIESAASDRSGAASKTDATGPIANCHSIAASVPRVSRPLRSAALLNIFVVAIDNPPQSGSPDTHSPPTLDRRPSQALSIGVRRVYSGRSIQPSVPGPPATAWALLARSPNLKS